MPRSPPIFPLTKEPALLLPKTSRVCVWPSVSPVMKSAPGVSVNGLPEFAGLAGNGAFSADMPEWDFFTTCGV